MDRTYISDASTIGTEGKCVAMYRFRTKAIDSKNIGDVIILNKIFKYLMMRSWVRYSSHPYTYIIKLLFHIIRDYYFKSLSLLILWSYNLYVWIGWLLSTIKATAHPTCGNTWGKAYLWYRMISNLISPWFSRINFGSNQNRHIEQLLRVASHCVVLCHVAL